MTQPALIGELPAFALAATLLILAPGPDNLLVIRNTLRNGRRAGWITATGTLSGLAVWAMAAAFGLSALVRASHLGYDILRFAGAAYLIWLGLSSLGLVRRRQPSPDRQPETGRAYLNGLLCNLFNPKVGVFFVAFLPGFIPAGAPSPLFPLGLGTWFIVETGAWLGALAWMTARGVSWMRRSVVARRLECLTGIVLIGFGLRLASEAR